MYSARLLWHIMFHISSGGSRTQHKKIVTNPSFSHSNEFFIQIAGYMRKRRNRKHLRLWTNSCTHIRSAQTDSMHGERYMNG